MVEVIKLIVFTIAIGAFAILVLAQFVLPKDSEGRK